MSTTLPLVAFLAIATAAHAQSFEKLSERIKPGQTVIVVDRSGAEVRGRLTSISASELVVDYGRGRIPDPTLTSSRTFAVADVQQVLKPGHLWDGAIKGAAIGAIPAIVNVAIDCYDCNEGPFAVFSIGVGAAAGLGLDALFGPKTVYRGNASPPRVSVAPLVGRERKGIAASIRF